MPSPNHYDSDAIYLSENISPLVIHHRSLLLASLSIIDSYMLLIVVDFVSRLSFFKIF